MTKQYSRTFRWLFAGVLVAACGTSEKQASIGDDPGWVVDAAPPIGPDTSCHEEGAVRECGRVEHMDGNYVTCSMGHQSCQNGHWTACAGDRYVTRSQPTRRIDGNGAYTLAVTAGPVCSNVCDPYCVTQQPDPRAVDAAGIQLGSGGGVTLAPEGGTEAGASDAGSGCSGLQCQIASCPVGTPTTLSGTVYDPAGKNPLYNAYVYVPRNLSDVPPPFSSGASCDTCGGTGSFNALQVAQTDASGRFTLTNVPSGTNIPVVVQMGKWRREIVLTTVSSCRDNTVVGNCTAPSAADCIFRLPKNHSDGYNPVTRTYDKADIPRIAIVSGGADPFDCLLLKAGIDPNEFGDNGSTKRVHYFESDNRPGNSLAATNGSQVVGSTLWNNLDGRAPNMMSYDVILLPCEGAAINKQTTGNTPYANLIKYANAGGRSFITHFGYVWLEYPAAKGYVAGPDNWGSVAVWTPTGTSMTSTVNTQDPLTGVVNTTFPKGGTFSQWLRNVGASTVPGQLTIHEGRQDLTTIGASAQPWMSATNTRYPLFPTYTNLFTFNAPWGAMPANQCGRVVYSDFHVSANALVGTTNQCLTDTDCGYTAVCNGSTPGSTGRCSEPCRTAADCPNPTYQCAGATVGTCQAATCRSDRDCGGGRKCNNGICSCASNADCGNGVCSGATCTPIACTSSAQCGAGTCGGGRCDALACHRDTDCGLGRCGGGNNDGTCAAGASCHTDSECGPTGTCGTGVGSSTGTCSTSSAACHRHGDCDSNVCGSGSGASSGTCTAGLCTRNSDCGAGGRCTLGVCTSGTCSVDADCGTSPPLGVCTGATCRTRTCANDTSCGVSRVCNGARCSRSSCSNDGQCPLGTCSGAACTPPASCGSNAECGTGGRCRNAMCSANACSSNADCGAGSSCNGSCTVNSCVNGGDCVSGVCSNGVCGCTANEQCATSQTCVGATQGTCQKACTTDAECAPDTCYNGQCGGCRTSNDCHDNAFPPRCTGVTPGSYGTCSVHTPGEFPAACRQGALSPQEKALEFMFFDLTACVSPDNAPPPTPQNPPPFYSPATFNEHFRATCPKGTGPIWREFDWQSLVPAGASIVFEAQSGDDGQSLKPATPLTLATSTTSTDTGVMNQNYDVAFIDTGRNGSGAFNKANPPVVSRDMLKLKITLQPTPDRRQAPTLLQWKVQYDCVPDQ